MKTHTKAEVARQPQVIEWVKASEARAMKRQYEENLRGLRDAAKGLISTLESGLWPDNGEMNEMHAQLARTKYIDLQADPWVEAKQVLERISRPGWLFDAFESGNVSLIASEVCAIKREARAVLISIGRGAGGSS